MHSSSLAKAAADGLARAGAGGPIDLALRGRWPGARRVDFYVIAAAATIKIFRLRRAVPAVGKISAIATACEIADDATPQGKWLAARCSLEGDRRGL